jgi:hypothetical protein
MAHVALLRHAKPKSKNTKAHISNVLSEHAVSNTWWEQTSMPDWLTMECYVEQIQPLLKGKKVREIAEAMHVSQPYAAFVRSGRRRPHPRHWLVLARLAGISESAKESNKSIDLIR